MKVLLIDNYDSFTFNLFHILEDLDVEVTVIRHDKVKLHEVSQYDKVVFSPGPGLPKDVPIMHEILRQYAGQKPILGVCLGMQSIAEFYGGKLVNQQHVKHGVAEKVEHNLRCKLFENIPSIFTVGLYHSWKVELTDSTDLLGVAQSEYGVLMALQHQEYPVYGVQFHPESIMTECGKQILSNFVNI